MASSPTWAGPIVQAAMNRDEVVKSLVSARLLYDAARRVALTGACDVSGMVHARERLFIEACSLIGANGHLDYLCAQAKR